MSRKGPELEFSSDISPEDFRKFFNVLNNQGVIARGYEYREYAPFILFRTPRGSGPPDYQTKIYILPQKYGSRFTIQNEYEENTPGSFPAIGWPEISEELLRAGYQLTEVTGRAITIPTHSYVDPGEITNPNHRRVIEALIRAELSGRRFEQKDIAEELEYSPSRVSEIKKIYLKERSE